MAAFSLFLASLFCLVCHIGGLISNKQMSWVNARRIVASMENVRFGHAICNFPGKSVGSNLFAVGADSSVSVSIKKSSPYPTWTEFWAMRWDRPVFVYICPKPVFSGFWTMSSETSARTENASSHFDVKLIRKECFSTTKTSSVYLAARRKVTILTAIFGGFFGRESEKLFAALLTGQLYFRVGFHH